MHKLPDVTLRVRAIRRQHGPQRRQNEKKSRPSHAELQLSCRLELLLVPVGGAPIFRVLLTIHIGYTC